MPEIKDAYYSQSQVSNSDLSFLKRYWQSYQIVCDLETIYRFGTLLDCMITEPHKIDYYQFTCAGYKYTPDEFEHARRMYLVFFRDEFCRLLADNSEMQKTSKQYGFAINYQGFDFALDVRCKWDFFAMQKLKLAADLKSTNCETQKSFETAVLNFDYDRQAAWYMDIEGVDSFMLVGISKKNFKIFKVPVRRGDALYNSGKAKYQELAFKHWCLFENLKIAA